MAKLYKKGEKAAPVPPVEEAEINTGEKARNVHDGKEHYQDRKVMLPETEKDYLENDIQSKNDVLDEDVFDVDPDVSNVSSSDIKSNKAKIKWSDDLLKRIKSVRKTTSDVQEQLDRINRIKRRVTFRA